MKDTKNQKTLIMNRAVELVRTHRLFDSPDDEVRRLIRRPKNSFMAHELYQSVELGLDEKDVIMLLRELDAENKLEQYSTSEGLIFYRLGGS